MVKVQKVGVEKAKTESNNPVLITIYI